VRHTPALALAGPQDNHFPAGGPGSVKQCRTAGSGRGVLDFRNRAIAFLLSRRFWLSDADSTRKSSDHLHDESARVYGEIAIAG
jgi:hypothetical protein